MKASEHLTKALKLLGPGGKHWIKGDYTDNYGGMCSSGALKSVPGATRYAGAGEITTPGYPFLCRAVGVGGGMIADWNDARRRTWTEVRAGFLKAIRLAKQAEKEAK